MDIEHDRNLNPNAWLKRLKGELGIKAAHRLLAMAGTNDPFNKGTEGDFVKAEWFAGVYEKFGYHGIHLRRLHYRMAHSDETLTLWDGDTEYLNIERHWEKLQEASIAARILHVVDAYDFTEKRNKAVPTLHQEGSGKPGRILYVSDFDPAGQAMPVSVARHCQFACWELEELAGEAAPSIKVDTVAVTREQVEELDIPRIPIKETDLRKARFELTHGVGAVEVEALETVHPGKLADILRERIEELQDADLARKVEQRRVEANALVADAINEIIEEHRENLEDIAERARRLSRRYDSLYEQLGDQVAERYRRLAQRFERHVTPLREELINVEHEVRQAIEGLDVALPELPEGEADEDEERRWLFDSAHDFVAETDHLREVQGKE